MRKIKVLIACLALITVVQTPAMGKTLRIGTLSPLKGPYSQDGMDILQGVKTAVVLVEQAGGIPGFDKIKVIPEDSACDGEKATLAANKLIAGGVAAVVGAYCSSATIPASNPLNANRIIQLTPASVHEEVTERGFKYLFRVCPRDDAEAAATVSFLENALKIRTLALIDDTQTYMVRLTKKIIQFAEKHGKIEIVAHEHITPGDEDFTALLIKLKKIDPDAIYMGVYQPEGSLMSRQAKALGLRAQLLTDYKAYHPKFPKVPGKTTDGIYLTSSKAPDTPEGRDFEARYKKMWGVDKIGNYAYYAFDATNIILGAVRITMSTNPDKLEQTIRYKAWKGATGTIKFDSKGDRESNYIIWILENGKFVPYWDPQKGQHF